MAIPMFRLDRECQVAPAGDDPVMQGRSVYANFFGPCGHALRPAAPRNHSVMADVTLLLFNGCPPAVGFVVAILAVYAVQGGAFGALAHIAQEVFKVLPFRGIGLAGIAVAVMAVWVPASRFHRCPRVV